MHSLLAYPAHITVRLLIALSLCWCPVVARTSTSLPSSVSAALARAKVPPEALAALVVDVQGSEAARLRWQVDAAMNPASVMKLVTTYAALDLLGPAFTWDTPVYLDGVLQGGRLRGNVYLAGRGDPKLVVERLWLLLRRLRAQGIESIEGDIVLDRSAFKLPERDAARFDGEPWRAYNVAPDALLLNYNAVVMTFVPDVPAGVAHVSYEPPLARIQRPATVPLVVADKASGARCGDWRAGLRASFDDPTRISFAGSYPASCGEQQWPAALAEPRSFAARAVEGMWRELGGQLNGRVREGAVPARLKPVFSVRSPAMAEVVRDINKYSNNVMAQQAFLTLALQSDGVGTLEGARTVVARWWQQHGVVAGTKHEKSHTLVMDNGSGLSRHARVTASGLAHMLQHAWASPVMPELLASLPVTGVDGTLRHSQSRVARGKGKWAKAAAHLKTGTLRDVTAIAGYVHATSGKRYVLVAFINHQNAAAARPAIEALVDWAADDG